MTKLFFKTSAMMIIALCMMLTSCQDEFTTEESILNYETEFAAATARTNSCFELVYPVTIELSDGTQLSVEDNTALRTAAKADIETNGREVGSPDLIYPIDVIVDGETLTVTDQESLDAIKAECGNSRNSRNSRSNGNRGNGNNGRGESCFSLVYPLTIEFSDGTEMMVASREERKEAVEAFKEANPDVEERPGLQFPISVTLADSTEQVVASQEELESLKEACGGNSGRSDRRRGNDAKCFSLEFPLTYTFADGSMVTINSREEKKEAFMAFNEANPDVEEKAELTYPVSILFEDGTTMSVANEEELDAAKEMCNVDESEDDTEEDNN